MTTQPNQERQRAERVGRRLQMSGLLYNNSDSTVALIVRIIEEEMIPALTPPTAIQKPKEGHCVTEGNRLTEFERGWCSAAAAFTAKYGWSLGGTAGKTVELGPHYETNNDDHHYAIIDGHGQVRKVKFTTPAGSPSPIDNHSPCMMFYCESALSSPRQESHP